MILKSVENFEVFAAVKNVLGVDDSLTNEYSDPNKSKDIEKRAKDAEKAQKDLEATLNNQEIEESLTT